MRTSGYDYGTRVRKQEDIVLEALDIALDEAEQKLLPLIATLSPVKVAEMFKQHCQSHLTIELLNYACHGNKDDCADHDLKNL